MIEKNLPWLGATYFILTLMAWVVFGSAGGHIVHAASFDEITRRKTSALAILTEKSLPSVVSISVAKNIENERSSGKTTPLGKTKPSKKSAIKALGSGFIIDKTGIIVTNHHVIAQTLDQSRVKSNTKPNDLAQFIDVTLANHQKYRATLIGSDELADLALLKIEAKTALPFLRIGNSDLVKVGDWVMAVGNPFGLDGTVTVGIISARRSYKESGGETDLLQTDAPIDHGNSGGPMLNMAGEVVGINSSIFANEKGESVRIGFAIASNDAQPILANLRQFGRFKRGSLGLSLQRLEPELVSNYIPNAKPTHGVLVSLVESQGAAA
ncbi:MAG: trypsin-like peptidase domain-containing protein [Alphaproteobacteria bacterium]|nr:trypsin-like peptidase domain-containing protein [Alphaproteobacteria bacterium]